MAPHFIGIGAQRAGTGWLYHNLAKHPDIWLTPVKELHYFDDLYQSHSLAFRFRDPHWRRMALARLLRDSLPSSRGTISWDLRYFFGKYSDDWYLSLFRPEKHQIAGEITPAYAALDEGMVLRVSKLVPEARIIFVMRNPVERAWSHAINRFVGRNKLSYHNVADEQLLALINSENSYRRSDYLRTIGIWESNFPADKMFYGFYDDIGLRPNMLLSELCKFLEVDPTKLCLTGSERDRTKAPMGSRYAIPPHIRLHIVKKYLPLLEQLSARFGGHADNWLHEANSFVRRTKR